MVLIGVIHGIFLVLLVVTSCHIKVMTACLWFHGFFVEQFLVIWALTRKTKTYASKWACSLWGISDAQLSLMIWNYYGNPHTVMRTIIVSGITGLSTACLTVIGTEIGTIGESMATDDYIDAVRAADIVEDARKELIQFRHAEYESNRARYIDSVDELGEGYSIDEKHLKEMCHDFHGDVLSLSKGEDQITEIYRDFVTSQKPCTRFHNLYSPAKVTRAFNPYKDISQGNLAIFDRIISGRMNPHELLDGSYEETLALFEDVL